MRSLWDYCSESGKNEIEEWLSSLDVLDRDRILQKLDTLAAQDFDVFLHTNAIAGPLKGFRHLYKVRATAKTPMRLILCQGPVAMEDEFTLLFGAREADGRYKPPNALDMAAEHLQQVRNNPGKRRKKRETL
jgi:hypothetical protein